MSSELTFRDRFKAVAGDQPHSWGTRKGLDKAFIANCLRGTSKPQQRNLDKLVAASGIPEEWWLHGDLPPPEPGATAHHRIEDVRGEYVAIPLYNGVRAAAGGGALVEHETPDDALMFKDDWVRIELGVRPSDLYLIRVAGDSMEPTLRSGDVILVNRIATQPDREGIYILRMDGTLLVKRLQALPGGVVRVHSDNASFPAFDVTRMDLESENAAIIGRVVWVGRRL